MAGTLNKNELVAAVAAASGQTASTVSGVLDALLTTIAGAVAKGDKVSIPGWLSFESADTAARTGRNPATGETIQIPAGKRLKVSAGSKLKAAVK